MRLKEELKNLLKAKDVTASEFSRRTGIPKTTISDWLGGRAPKDIRQVKKAAEELGVSLDFLCFGANPIMTQDEKVTNLESLFGNDWIGGFFEVRFMRIKK